MPSTAHYPNLVGSTVIANRTHTQALLIIIVFSFLYFTNAALLSAGNALLFPFRQCHTTKLNSRSGTASLWEDQIFPSVAAGKQRVEKKRAG
ncbi:MAG: hypothetical protein ABI813_06215 [Bacteroidota bacterium]